MIRTPWVIGLVVLLCLIFVVNPPMKIVESPPRNWSANNLKHIAEALLSYHATYKRLPPPVIRDQAGRPLYSWRVAILPHLAHADLYKEFDLNEPWDGPTNRRLLSRMPWEYGLPGSEPKDEHTTHYQIICGPGTLFEGRRLILRDIPDGADRTFLVVEANEPVPWSKPGDLEYDPREPLPCFGRVYSIPRKFLGWEIDHYPGFNAAFADGRVRFIRSAIDEHILRALITRNGGEQIDLPSLD
jgi:hypothetical protein